MDINRHKIYRFIEAFQKEPRPYTVAVPSIKMVAEAANDGRLISTIRGGYALVKKSGDITCIFKTDKRQKNVLPDILKEAVKRGGYSLNCFDGYLTELYRKCGFEVVRRERFNPIFAPPNMPQKERDKTPDIVFFELPLNGEVI